MKKKKKKSKINYPIAAQTLDRMYVMMKLLEIAYGKDWVKKLFGKKGLIK